MVLTITNFLQKKGRKIPVFPDFFIILIIRKQLKVGSDKHCKIHKGSKRTHGLNQRRLSNMKKDKTDASTCIRAVEHET